MGVTKDLKTGEWIASHSARHPITRQPTTLRRKAKTQAEANRIFKQLVIEISDKHKQVLVPKWECLVEEYLQSRQLQGHTAKTINNCEKCLKAATQPWKERFVDSIVTDEIRNLVLTKYGGDSISHQKSILKFIRCAFEFAVEKGYIGRNPAPRMKFKMGDKIRNFLTESQVRDLLEKAKNHSEWYYHYVLAIYTGMRNGELYALTWDKIDFSNNQIKVDRAWNNKNGFTTTKSGDDRWVEIAPVLKTVLQELKLKVGQSKFVLPRFSKWDDGLQAEELRKFQLGFNLPQTRFHDLRATWCTLMLSKGIEPLKVMRMGGWKDIKTMQIYIRHAGVDIKGIANCLQLHDPNVNVGKVINFHQV